MNQRTSIWCAALVLVVAGHASAEETKGTIKSADAGRNAVTLKGIIENSTYELNKDAFICLDGVKSKLGDLQEGDHAVIVYEKRGNHLMASEVRGLRNAKETSGTVRDTFAEKSEITLKGTIKDATYELDKNATVWLNGQKSSLKDIRANDHVLVTYQVKGDHNMAACVRATRK